MKTKNIILIALMVLLAGMISCQKDHDIPTGKVFTYYEYVDLGLPSGLLWATCNVGADSPEEYGDYFAWGETQPKSDYSWSTYQYCDGYKDILTKYCNNASYGYNGYTDTLTVLEASDDAATAQWGSGWRMPTQAECQELVDNTTFTWTTQNGVKGCLFTATNGNSLFLPAAGYRDGSSLDNVGTYGFYWSSSLGSGRPYNVRYLEFHSGGCYVGHIGRGEGLPVRPVRSVQTTTEGLPVLTTSGITEITATSAKGGGEVTDQGASNVTERGICWGTSHNPTTSGSHANSGTGTGSFTVNMTGLTANTTYYVRAYAVNSAGTSYGSEVSFTTLPSGGTHAYVDLGLPSGLLWATCNVGADNSEDYGDYFAWGETQPKSDYSWSTYQYCNGSDNTLTKYCSNSSYGYNGFTDNLTTLQPSDDAATAQWGSGWRMPTQAECQELVDNTTFTWTTQNGVKGCLFTATNGNSLFLPAAGYRDGTSLYGAGTGGYYWSSSLITDNPSDAWKLLFHSDNCHMSINVRYYGLSVRPVRSASKN